MTDRKKVTEMDASVQERAEPIPHTNTPRSCWAIKQLVREVQDLFPETTFEVSNRNERNVALDVLFHTNDQVGLRELLSLVDGDPRVRDVIGDDGQSLRISFHNRAATQDLRDEFGLADAWEVISDREEAVDETSDMEGGDASHTSDDVEDGGGA